MVELTKVTLILLSKVWTKSHRNRSHLFINFSIIHTDVFARGVLSPAGHVDYYVNGGFDQPGCYHQLQMSPGSCNHERAPEYYAESIYSEIGFWGFRCGKSLKKWKKNIWKLKTYFGSSLVSLRAWTVQGRRQWLYRWNGLQCKP